MLPWPFFLEGVLKKTTTKFNNNSWLQGQICNLERPEYEDFEPQINPDVRYY
jgi:hypothetical protein